MADRPSLRLRNLGHHKIPSRIEPLRILRSPAPPRPLNFRGAEIAARVELIQSRNHDLLERGGAAIVALIDAIVKAKAAGAGDAQLEAARALQRKAQWRLDFVAAENSMGFHAPQETARLLAEAIDYARQGQVAALEAKSTP